MLKDFVVNRTCICKVARNILFLNAQLMGEALEKIRLKNKLILQNGKSQ